MTGAQAPPACARMRRVHEATVGVRSMQGTLIRTARVHMRGASARTTRGSAGLTDAHARCVRMHRVRA
eukprot:5595632-Pleurochrysis_carterae.AAC.1